MIPCSGNFWKLTWMPVCWVNSGMVCSTQVYCGEPSAVHMVMLFAMGADDVGVACWAAASEGEPPRTSATRASGANAQRSVGPRPSGPSIE